MTFYDRTEAGELLADRLEKYSGEDVVVYALPRGGVVLGLEIARRLCAPLDLVIPRKIGHPLHPEYAICAITEDGYLICNQEEAARHDTDWLKRSILAEHKEAQRRRQLYMSGRENVSVEGKVAIVVDDGIATGLTMMAAIEDLKDRRPSKIVLAVPVIPADTIPQLRRRVNEIVAVEVPKHYRGAVGSYYRDFDQVEDDEVIRLLDTLDGDGAEEESRSAGKFAPL